MFCAVQPEKFPVSKLPFTIKLAWAPTEITLKQISRRMNASADDFIRFILLISQVSEIPVFDAEYDSLEKDAPKPCQIK